LATHFGEVLDTARRQHFVGRQRELISFDDALAGRSARRVLFVHVRGYRQTTLLLEFRARARAASRSVVQVDGRDIDPSPQGPMAALLAAIGHDSGDPIAQLPTGAVPLIDGYEQLSSIDGWGARRTRPQPERRQGRGAGRPRPTGSAVAG
jgi:hypothetical protein